MLAMAEEAGVVLLEFLDRPALTAELDELKARYGYAAAPGEHAHLDQLERELAEYSALGAASTCRSPPAVGRSNRPSGSA